ncbi:MAG: hypothetical protein LBN39_09980 [Planctomycetaceae bacterium]|jgi:hypothetical protein|nr:hypothetical protein [Planctomycetaceae bacterium]
MGTLSQIIDNHINPLMLRELRQMVRNRLVVVLLHLYLAVLVFTCFCFTLAEMQTTAQNEGSGSILFGILTSIMSLTCFLAIFGLTVTTTAAEQVSEDLMFISTLRPSSIVFGKAWAGAVLTVMLMSATAPFVMLAYLLRGLDIQTITLTFCSVFVSIQVLNSIAVASGANIKTKAQMSGLAVGGLCLFLFCIMPAFASMVFASRMSFGIGMSNFWFILFSMFCGAAGVIAVFLSLAVRAFSPPASNRSLPVRLTVFAVFIGSFLFVLFSSFSSLMPYLFAGPSVGAVFTPWCGIWFIFLCFLTLVVVCEPNDWSVRVRHSISKNILFRSLAFPFYTGAANGFAWWFVMLACVCAVCIFTNPPLDRGIWYWLLFSFDYTLTAMFLRLRFASKICKPEQTGIIVLILAITLIFGGAICYTFAVADLTNLNLFEESYTDSFFAMFNPFCLFRFIHPYSRYHSGVPFQEFCSAGWAALLAVPFVLWFIRRCWKFTPNDLSGVMTYEDAVEAVKQAENFNTKHTK